MKISSTLKITSIFIAAMLAFFSIYGGRQSAQTKAPTAAEKFKSIKVLNDMPAEQLGKVMNMMSSSLGVNCRFCHASNDGEYEKEGFEHKDIAREMLKMTFDINAKFFEGKNEVSCNTCHNGRPHPQSGFQLGVVKAPPRPRVEPDPGRSTASILARNADHPNNPSKTFEIRSIRVEPDGKTTEPETIFIRGEKYSSDLLYGNYLVREIFDGVESRKYGMTDPIQLKPDEALLIKRDAEVLSGRDLTAVYAQFRYVGLQTVEGRKLQVVEGAVNGLRERLYFEEVSGSLVRRTISSATVIGDFVLQIDYFEFKRLAGIRIPTIIKYSLPNISWTRKIISLKRDGRFGDDVFGIPVAPKK